MAKTELATIYSGALVDMPDAGDARVLPRAHVGVDSLGRVAFVASDDSQLAASLDAFGGSESVSRVEIGSGRIMLPGFVDAHIHAPQYAFLGIGTNVPLLQWLNKYTFPFEARCADDSWAKRVYSAVVRRTLSSGTTTASYFATIHNSASIVLAKEAMDAGQRAFVGKVSMDRNAPDFYIESTDSALLDAEAFVKGINDLDSDLVSPILTPRFVPTCTSRLMTGLGDIAKRTGIPIQTHVSENNKEIEWVKELHPESKSYTGVYADHGLLTTKTLLAHGVHLSDSELEQINLYGSSVVHCPLSNFSLTSGVASVRRMMQFGVNVALGTDVSGGGSSSMFSAMQMALVASQAANIQDRSLEPLGWKDVLKMATVGGARALGIAQDVGGLTRGKFFDAIVVDTCCSGPYDTFGWESVEELAEKTIVCGDDRNVAAVYVRGNKVYSANRK